MPDCVSPPASDMFWKGVVGSFVMGFETKQELDTVYNLFATSLLLEVGLSMNLQWLGACCRCHAVKGMFLPVWPSKLSSMNDEVDRLSALSRSSLHCFTARMKFTPCFSQRWLRKSWVGLHELAAKMSP